MSSEIEDEVYSDEFKEEEIDDEVGISSPPIREKSPPQKKFHNE